MSTNINNMMNESVMQKVSENQMAIDRMNELILAEGFETPTEMYVDVLFRAIVDLKNKERKTDKDYSVLLKYTQELDKLMGINNQSGFRMVPTGSAVVEDTLS